MAASSVTYPTRRPVRPGGEAHGHRGLQVRESRRRRLPDAHGSRDGHDLENPLGDLGAAKSLVVLVADSHQPVVEAGWVHLLEGDPTSSHFELVARLERRPDRTSSPISLSTRPESSIRPPTITSSG